MDKCERFFPKKPYDYDTIRIDVEMAREVFKSILKHKKGNKLIKVFLFNSTYSYRGYDS